MVTVKVSICRSNGQHFWVPQDIGAIRLDEAPTSELLPVRRYMLVRVPHST